jgi:hypothetical protein
MRRQGYDGSVPGVRTGRYGGPDITVTVIRSGVIKHIQMREAKPARPPTMPATVPMAVRVAGPTARG